MWIDDFLAALASPSLAKCDITQVREIKDQNLPRSIFRYRPINKYTLEELEKDTIWLTPPEDFNDPYDSAVSISSEALLAKLHLKHIEAWLANNKTKLTDGETAEILAAAIPMEKFGEVLLSKDDGMSQEQRIKFLEVLKNYEKKNSDQFSLQVNRNIRTGLHICCFSETNTSITMWSHYADQHRGVCLEFDISVVSSDDIRRRALYPVIYKDEIFDVTPYYEEAMLGGQFNNLFFLLASIYKAREWQYEREWRLIIPFKPPTMSQSYPMLRPKALYLGSRIKPSERDAILSIARRRGIGLFQMGLAKDAFRLDPHAV